MTARLRIAVAALGLVTLGGLETYRRSGASSAAPSSVVAPASAVAARVAAATRPRLADSPSLAHEGEPESAVAAPGEDPQWKGLTRDELREEAAYIDSELTRRDAVARLNKNEASVEERIELGNLIERFTLLRHELVTRDVADLEAKVAAYEQEHGARMAKILAQAAPRP